MAEGAEVFPFDPKARAERLRGLQKLRAFEDRELAGYLFALWQALPAGAPSAKRQPPHAQLVFAGVA